MRKLIILVLCIIVLGIASSCVLNSSVDKVTFPQVDASTVKDSDLTEMLNSNLNDGVYELRTDKKCYIIFNGSENSYKDITYKAKNNTFQIIFSTDKLMEKKQTVYKLVLPESMDTIELMQDGEQTAFQSVYVY